MQIAILGAGFCGLASAWHLLQNSKIKVCLFDPAGIGGGASGIAAGLLHPFAGLHAKLNWCGYEGMTATRRLLEVSSNTEGVPVFENAGLMRLAITDEQRESFFRCTLMHPQEVSWQENTDFIEQGSFPGIWIKSALTVNCGLYLKGLWKACMAKGARLENIAIEKLSDLKEFDAIVITIGAFTSSLKESAHIPITQVKGQILEFQWPGHLADLPYPINSQAYFIYNSAKKSCLVGSTFERNFSHPLEDPFTAMSELSPKFSPLFPSLNNAKILNCRSGIRASTPNHLPILEKVAKNVWVLTGMGSKGLLYHALMAEKLSKLLLSDFSML